MVLRAHGGPEVLEREEIEIAPPGPREALVRVQAVAMNHMDLWVRRGLPHLKRPPPPPRQQRPRPPGLAHVTPL